MYYNIYEISRSPILRSVMDAYSVGEHIIFLGKCAVADELEEKEVNKELQNFGKWLKKEGLGTLKSTSFTLSDDVSHGKHFADRYAGFHQLTQTLSAISKEDYLHRFHDVRNLASDLMKAIVDDDDDYVWMDGSLFTMDEFLRQATPGVSYHIGNICKYHR